MRGTEKSVRCRKQHVQSPGVERKHSTFESANFGLNRALSMKQEVRRVASGELSWGQVHEVLELFPVWGFEWSGGEGVPAMIRFVA